MNGQTAIFYAAARGHWGVVKLLVEKGAIVGVSAKNGRTPLFVAVQHRHMAIVELLLATGRVDIGAKDNYGRTALSYATERQ
ncbi:ankyrin repeat-containing domain protein, partial [Mariannaea sp. PMI_226]